MAIDRSSTLSRRTLLGCAGALGLAPAAKALAWDASGPSSVLLPGGSVPSSELAVGSPLAPGVMDAAVAMSSRYGHKALLVWHDGALIAEHYGDGVSRQTPLPAFSMAKSVLGIMTGVALEAGVIQSIEDPVGAYLEPWADDPRGQISLRQLLQMRSGLKLYSLAAGAPEALEMTSGSRLSQTALATPLEGQPGREFLYANVNSQILGMALDAGFRRQGLGGYVEVLQSRLWGPLGQGPASIDVEFAGGQPRYFAGLNATARDWLRLGRLFVDGGQAGGRTLVADDWLTTMAEPSPNPQYGLHLWRGSPWLPRRAYGPGDGPSVPCLEPYVADDMVLFDGAGGQRVYISRKTQLVIVRLGSPSWDWEDSALPNFLSRNLPSLQSAA